MEVQLVFVALDGDFCMREFYQDFARATVDYSLDFARANVGCYLFVAQDSVGATADSFFVAVPNFACSEGVLVPASAHDSVRDNVDHIPAAVHDFAGNKVDHNQDSVFATAGCTPVSDQDFSVATADYLPYCILGIAFYPPDIDADLCGRS